MGYIGQALIVIRNHLNIITNVCAQLLVVAVLLHLFLENRASNQNMLYDHEMLEDEGELERIG